MTIEIPLTRGYVALIDDEDADLVGEHKWCVWVQKNGGPYAVRSTTVNSRPVHFRMHRVILNAPPGREVDHINRNGLDNRRSNLRLATHAQNEANKPPRGEYKGAYWCKKSGRWRASIRVDGRLRHMGRFATREEAARVYDDAALEAFGEFAYLNFPRDH